MPRISKARSAVRARTEKGSVQAPSPFGPLLGLPFWASPFGPSPFGQLASDGWPSRVLRPSGGEKSRLPGDQIKNRPKWGIHLTQVAPRRCGLVDPQTPARCTQNAPWGARRRPERRLGHEATFRAYQRSRTRHGHRRLENMVLSASLSGGRQWPTTVSCSHLSQVDTPPDL